MGDVLNFRITNFDLGPDYKLLPDGRIFYRNTGHNRFNGDQTFEIPPERWAAFWEEIDRIGVWTWKPLYVIPSIEGPHWDLALEHNGRSVHSAGSNAYPESDARPVTSTGPGEGPFEQFFKALQKLTEG